MNSRAKKIILLLLAAALLLGSSRVQNSMNHDRQTLGLTRTDVLKDAPPVLAFTTVALGGFRGLISNYLWIRANDLQLDDKYFEAAQLADWITDLEPRFPQVWAFQAWNMAWNISVKFKSFADRWHWVENGMRLLRDNGLRYNPNSILLYQQLSWIFQSKIGQNMDDANAYYKRHWAEDMTPFFGPHGTNFAALLHPQTPEERTNVMILREKYKIDPEFANKVNNEWGPLDWRTAEAHAIYWAALGMQEAKEHPGKVKKKDVMTLRRSIYQSMLQAFHHGRYIASPLLNQGYVLGPDLALIPKVNEAYEKMYAEEADPGQKNGILDAQRNFICDAVYFLYENNHMAAAKKWYKFLSDKFPNKTILDGDTNSFPRNLTLDQYAVRRVQEEVGDTSQERTTAVVQGLLVNAYSSLAIGQQDRYAGFKLLAAKVYENYRRKTSELKSNKARIGLPPFADINREVLKQLLDPKDGMPYAARAIIRTQLGLPAETNAPPTSSTSTNAPAVTPSTNAPATNAVTSENGTDTNSVGE